MCVMMMGMMMNRKYGCLKLLSQSEKVTIFDIHNYSRRFRLPKLYEKGHLQVNKKGASLTGSAFSLVRLSITGGLELDWQHYKL